MFAVGIVLRGSHCVDGSFGSVCGFLVTCLTIFTVMSEQAGPINIPRIMHYGEGVRCRLHFVVFPTSTVFWEPSAVSVFHNRETFNVPCVTRGRK